MPDKTSFQQALDHIRASAPSEPDKGGRFERLIKTYFQKDRYYQQRFAKVQTWKEWVYEQKELGVLDGIDKEDGTDTGIDLVAEEADGGEYCAIQCKCYAAGTRISKDDIDKFLGASGKKWFTSRIIVSTGDGWGANAERQLKNQNPPVQRIFQPDLERSAVDWPDLAKTDPEALKRREPFQLRPHQKEALNDVLKGFETHDRGKMIMACGTGKTFAALRIAERAAGEGGRVLYLVPSIALFGQAMREWAEQRKLEHRYIGVCSDKKAGYADEDAQIYELEIPVTTDAEKIGRALQKTDSGKMTVVFSTYHSLPLIEAAQENGAPEFDLILCDEAHRTTGIERADGKTSHFSLVHDNERIRAQKRLYMTATPRLYTDAAKTRAAKHVIGIYSMDDETVYGSQFHRLSFSKAVQQNLLSDYKVVLFAVTEAPADAGGATYLEADDAGGAAIDITDATKIVGCWKALHNPEHAEPGEEKRLSRAILFANTIKNSKAFKDNFERVVERAVEMENEQKANRPPDEENPEREELPKEFECETAHVDGKDHALIRKRRIDWLKRENEPSSNGSCRILSNARCLSEGVDVPALDAVIFIEPKRSIIDIVQAVGRVMRKFEGKGDGYIILPVACPADADGAEILNDNDRFKPIWDVLQALRAHDERLDAEINQIDLNKKTPERIILPPSGNFLRENEETYGEKEQRLLFPTFNIPPGAIYAKIVEKCGDRKYWEKWAADVADIFQRVALRVGETLDNPDNRDLKEWFDAFHKELQSSINDSITEENARGMLAQHIITGPVFRALFDQYDFANRNPVAKALEGLQKDFGEFGLEDETRDLNRFYESVRNRAQGLDNSAAKQTVLLELYEKFFQTAFKKDADRLGIVYTPVQIVDFILHSADDILQKEFGKTLSDEGVHILDPFTGAGVFLTRLLQSGLIKPRDLQRKYAHETHANEILLLAYYIAAVNIEEAYRGQRGEETAYEPFNGIVLTDTFNIPTDGQRALPECQWLKGNAERMARQQNAPIEVIVGNPPWSAGQRNAADNNPNLSYPIMEARIRKTYAARSTANNKMSLYDSYKMALRWASDRIQERGIAAFVTNGSWLDGNADGGIRACFADEFSTVYVMNLRGDARTSGERRRAEKGNVFGHGTRTPVAITLLVKNPDAGHEGCRIHYRDIGDYLTREQKLEILREKRSVNGIDDWRDIKPNAHHEWINQRSEAFQKLYPVGTEEAKAGKANNAVFKLYSSGLYTKRDYYIYSFSREACAENARKMAKSYFAALAELECIEKPTKTDTEEVVRNHTSNIKWEGDLKAVLKQKKRTQFSEGHIRKVVHRPFVATNCYADYTFIARKHLQDRIFPDAESENRVICVPGKGSKKPFSALMVDIMPDVSILDTSQCFPRWRYEEPSGGLPGLRTERIDNISDSALFAFRSRYGGGVSALTKDDIFYYVYGVLHSPEYRDRFANDLSKELPRVPLAPDFGAFASAGRELAELHLGYESCAEYPLTEHLNRRGLSDTGGLQAGDCRIEKKMKFADRASKEALIVNSRLTLSGIPDAAHRYVVNGRSPLEWLIDRYQVKTDKQSGIVNDANAWFADDPTRLVSAIQRAVHVSVESARVIESLPPIE